MWTRRHVRIWFREHVKIVKFADDTKIIRLKDGYEAAYRCGVNQLDLWCCQNNLDLNIIYKMWRWQWTSGRTPLHYLPSLYLTPLQVSGIHDLPRSEVVIQYRYNHQKGPAEDVLPAPGTLLQTPGDNLFQFLPSGRHYRAVYTNTSSYLNTFFAQADTR